MTAALELLNVFVKHLWFHFMSERCYINKDWLIDWYRFRYEYWYRYRYRHRPIHIFISSCWGSGLQWPPQMCRWVLFERCVWLHWQQQQKKTIFAVHLGLWWPVREILSETLRCRISRDPAACRRCRLIKGTEGGLIESQCRWRRQRSGYTLDLWMKECISGASQIRHRFFLAFFVCHLLTTVWRGVFQMRFKCSLVHLSQLRALWMDPMQRQGFMFSRVDGSE